MLEKIQQAAVEEKVTNQDVMQLSSLLADHIEGCLEGAGEDE